MAHTISTVILFMALFSSSLLPIAAKNISDTARDSEQWSLELTVGDGPNQVGISPKMPERAPEGPEAIRVTDSGRICILDTVNRRILVLGEISTDASTIDLSDVGYARDLAVSGDAFLVMDTAYDSVYAIAGSIDKEIYPYKSNPGDPPSVGIESDTSGRIYWQFSDGTQVLLRQGMEVSMTASSADRRIGHTNNSVITTISIKDAHVGQISLGSGVGASTLEIHTSHALGRLKFLRQDQSGNSYVLVEELLESVPDFVVEATIRRFDPNGKQTGVALLPIANSYFVPSRFVDVDRNGQVYFLHVSETAVRVVRIPYLADYFSALDAHANDPDSDRLSANQDHNLSARTSGLTSITRDQIMSNARAYAELQWVATAANLNGTACSAADGRSKPQYLSNYSPGSTVTSVPYKWGGYVTISQFQNDMANGKAAGDVATSYVISCASGVDCSGYVSVGVWNDAHKTTVTIGDISYNLSKWEDLLRGDALNSTSQGHIVVYENRASDGGFNTYESTPACGGRVCHWYRSASYINSYYYPIRYDNVTEDNGPDYSPPSSDYSFCSWEGARCSFSDTRDVAYGVNGTFKFRYGVSGGIECNNNEFGDPWPGVKKACFTKPVSSGGSCSAPSLNSPGDGSTFSNGTITFSWSAVSGCSFNGYELRICTTSNVAGDQGCDLKPWASGTETTVTIPSSYYNRDLWWAVSATNTSAYNWSTPRRFRIDTQSSGGTWHAKYYDSEDMWWDRNNTSWFKCEEDLQGPTLNKDYGSAAPCGGMRNNGDHWVGDYRKRVNFPAGNYVFHSDHDDGAKLIIEGLNNGEPIMDAGGKDNTTVCNGQNGFYLSGDRDVRVILREEGGDAKITLTWDTNTSACIPPKPPAPTLKLPENGSTKPHDYNLTFQWNASSGASAYYLEWWGGPYTTLHPCEWTTATSCPIGTVIPGYTYQWRVKARNATGESDWSDTWSFTIQAQPSPCYTLTPDRAGSGSYPAASPTNSPGCPSGQYIAGTSISLTASPASGWRVGSWSGTSNDSSTSTTNSLTMPASNRTVTVRYIQDKPAPPSQLEVASVTSSSITLRWRDNSDNETGFRIYRWNGANVVWDLIGTVGANTTTFTDSGRPCANGDTYEVKAFNELGESAGSGWIGGSTSPCSSCYILSRTHTGSGSDPVANPTNSTGCPIDQYLAGASINLTASPASGWRVGSWTGTNNDSSTATTNNLTMPASDRTVTVIYVPDLANDDIGAPITISGLPYNTQQDASAATSAQDDPTFPCKGAAYYQTVWYRFTPSVSGSVSIDTLGSNYDTVLGVWTGTRGALQGVPNGCNDDASGGGSHSAATIMVSAGTTYFVEVASFHSSSAGTLRLNVAAETPVCYRLTRSHEGLGGSDPVASPTNSPGCPSGQYIAGASINLTASPASDWHVGSWSGTSNDSSTATTNSLIMPANNHTVSVTYVPTSGSDAYEPDDTYAQAKQISSDVPQTHTLQPVGDVDWVRLALSEQSGVMLETSGAGGDTVMYLYDSSLHQVDADDDDGPGAFSFIGRWCGANALPAGTYYVKVEEYGNDAEIAGYDLALKASSCAQPAGKVRAFVARFYQQCLNREPDREGLEGWTSQLLGGSLTGANLAETFIFSEEFVNRRTSNDEFLQILYRAFFNREPDSGGFNAWLSHLNNGMPRADVLANFTKSVEFANLSQSYGIVPFMSRQAQVEAFVTRFYRQCLGREPDAGGLAAWTARLLDGRSTGADVARGFILSEEFRNRATTDEQFLTIMYRAFFNREPDSGGYNAWLNNMRNGASRENVVYGFTHSQEFVNLCQRYRISAY